MLPSSKKPTMRRDAISPDLAIPAESASSAMGITAAINRYDRVMG
jgi:hypothetical protein